MRNRKRTIPTGRRLLVLGLLLALTSLALAQSDTPPGTTGAPSGPLPPAGQTKATVDRLRRQAKGVLEAFELASDIGGAVQLRSRLEQLRPQIEAKMPATGGVLVAAYIDETRIGEGKVRTLRSVRIVGAYPSEKEAREDLGRSHVTAANGPALPATEAPSPRVQTTPRFFWFAAPVRMPPLAKPEELAPAREKVSRLLEAARQTCEAESARLDIEWAAIQKENSRLNKARRLNRPETPAGTKVQEAGKKEIDAWEAGERQGIAAERQAAQAARQAAGRERAALAEMTKERCPAGYPYEQCEVHHAWKANYLARRQAHQAAAAQWDAQAQQRAASAAAREARLPQARDARLRDLDVRVRAAEKGRDAAESLRKEQSAFRERLSRFNEEDEALRQLRATVQEIRQVLAQLPPPGK
jgi:hypothetical protein